MSNFEKNTHNDEFDFVIEEKKRRTERYNKKREKDKKHKEYEDYEYEDKFGKVQR